MDVNCMLGFMVDDMYEFEYIFMLWCVWFVWYGGFGGSVFLWCSGYLKIMCNVLLVVGGI